MPGMRYKFIMADPDGDTDKLTFCGVEELVMEHYKNNGYPEGKNQNQKSDFHDYRQILYFYRLSQKKQSLYNLLFWVYFDFWKSYY